MGIIDNVIWEMDQVERIQRARQKAQQSAENWSPAKAAQASMLARLFPAMRPGVVSSLAKAGYDPADPIVQFAGENATRQWMQDHPGGREYGEQVMLALPPGQRRLLQEDVTQGPRRTAQFGARYRRVEGEDVSDEEVRQAGEEAVKSRRYYLENVGDLSPAEIEEDLRKFREAAETEARIKAADRFVKRTDTPEFKAQAQANQAPSGGLNPISRASAGLGGEVTGLARTGFMAMDAPLQEVQGQFRNVIGAVRGEDVNWLESQSDLGIALGGGGSSGSGLFVDPESAVAQERRRREAERGQIGGHSITFGRWLAHDVANLDVDTKPYQLMSGFSDLAVAVFADPTNIALGAAGKAHRAAELFQAPGEVEKGLRAGLIPGLRSVFEKTSGAKFLDSEVGQAGLRWLADNTNPREIHRALDRAGGVQLAAQLADANTPDAVRAILEPELGIRIRTVKSATINPDKPFRQIRAWDGDIPSRGPIDMYSHNAVAHEAELSLRNAKATDAQIDEVFGRIARAKNPEELNAAMTREVHGRGGVIDQILEAKGVTPEKRSSMLQIYAGKHKADRRVMMHQVGEQGTFPDQVMLGNEMTDIAGLPLLSELSPQFIKFPDGREIRRTVSNLDRVLTNPGVEISRTGLDWITDGWKRFQLLRPAWGVRVIAEEQLRMAAAGYDSMFNHPLRYIAWTMAMDPKKMPERAHLWDYLRPVSEVKRGVRKGLEVVGVKPRAAELELADAFTDAMTPHVAAYLDQPTVVSVGTKTTYYRDDVDAIPQFRESLASEITHLAHDPVANHVANADSIDDAVEWFTRGAGNEFRGRLATAYPTRFADEAGARRYIEDLQNNINYVTGSNGDLLETIKTGRFRDEDILLHGTTVNPTLKQGLDDYRDFWPGRIVGEQMRPVSDDKGYLDSFVNWAFGHLMTEHTNRLSRSPVFKQAYWREGERLISFGDDTAKTRLIAQAKDHNLGSRAIRRMERIQARGDLTFENLDEVAKGFALDEVQGLLYDITKRGRMMDGLRLVAPFGEAWKEVLTRWGTLIKENPAVLRRYQQVVQGLRADESDVFLGDEEGQGFFHKNSFGEEVFAYPGARFLTEKLLGVPVPLAGRVQGLSMFGTIIPSLGPVLQIPVARLLSTKPGPEWFKEALYNIEQQELPIGGTVGEQLVPFGAPGQEDLGQLTDVLNFAPPYIRSFATWATNGAANERTWGNDVAYMMAAKKSTGDYDDSPEDMQRLEDDAQAAVKRLYFIQGVAKAFAPSAPDEDWRTFTKNDGWAPTRALANDWRKILDKSDGDFDAALDEFVKRYGENALGATLPHYKASDYSVPMTEKGVQWVLEHPGIEDDLPHTFGFFAPEGGDLDLTMFSEDLRTGDRALVTPKQFRLMMTNLQANMVYQDKRDKVGDDPDEGQEAWLREWRIEIQKQYPDWGDTTGDLERPKLNQLVRELYTAVDHDAIRSTSAGSALSTYLGYRDKVIEQMERDDILRGDGLVSTRDDMTASRQWLRTHGDRLAKENPEFKKVWDLVLSREVRKGTEAEDLESAD